MKDSFFRSMTWLHTWAGLLVCWVLLLIFFAGSLSYFRHETSLWFKPELHAGVYRDYRAEALAPQVRQAQDYLSRQAPGARSWSIEFPTQRHPYLSYGWQKPPLPGQRRGDKLELAVSADGQRVISQIRDSRGGDFLYRLHFDLHYLPPLYARYLVGFCTLFMLIALVSGIVIHKRIFKDFFSFRRGKGNRSWLDVHNLSSVLALPYHLMITYSGLITLMFIYMPWAIQSQYQGDRDSFLRELNPVRVQLAASGRAAPLFDIDKLLPQVAAHWQAQALDKIVISDPGDEHSRIKVYLNTGRSITDEPRVMVFDGVSGDLLQASPEQFSAAMSTYDTFMALHTARFADPMLRLLFFCCGLLGYAMVATGTLMWARKLRQQEQKQLAKGQAASLGLRLVEGLNLSVIAGLPLATAAFFYANRLLPPGLEQRAQWEVHGFFIAWGCVALTALVDRSVNSWRNWLLLAAGLWGLLPVLNALTSPSDLLHNVLSRQWALVGVDLMGLVFGCGLFYAATKLRADKAVWRAKTPVPSRASL
ncbi:PepSY-associated TM helix domain-containing protein [Shewanella salipaludis]|uniref:PepSY domain-containing protein n=1 Tax=Shewanella salipaludis TaxID=2723052 RepID=A0A972JL49_9GAMM|nr:PepSY-associated TM helix domain-containing protein [Shewanella salipaludis]NMH65814.1 PepSY domain-containing protein [Shewanella salipaludis]